ncbi:MAG: ABC transporter permease [Alphaproteobacteria bacterium]|nr:ABC transporter permease [Alphaproteobacteria bacterium]
MQASSTYSQRLWRIGFRVFVGMCFLFLLLPVLVVVPLSFSAGSFLNYPLPGLSWQWYETVLEPYPWVFAFRNSLVIAIATTVLATILGTLAAYGLVAVDFRFKGAVVALIISPLVVPVVIVALATYFALAGLGLLGTFSALVLAHTILAVPFVFITVTAALQRFDWVYVRAAQSLGASPLRTFFDTTFPMTLPGVIAGAIFAFVTSFDDVVVALFLSSPATLTLPRQLFSGIRDQLDPSIVAAATFLILVSVALLATVEFLRWWANRGGSGQ